MYPVDFPESNRTLNAPEGMSDCKPLEIYTDGVKCVSCWKLSIIERVSAVIFGRVWIYVRSGETQPPIYLGCERTIFE